MMSPCRSPGLVALFALAVGVGCHRPAPAVGGGDAADDAALEARPNPPAVGPSRCRATEWGVGLAGDAGDAELDLGDAVPFGDAIAVSLVRRIAGDRVAAVAFVRPDSPEESARVVDLGPTLGDAPPPRIVGRAGEIVAAFHAALVPRAPFRPVDRGETARPLLVRSVTAEGATPLFSIDEGRDDSLASDVAVLGDHGIVVWDEATSEPRGVIRGAPFAGRQRSGIAVDLSPKDSDAEMPRVVPFEKGFAVFWIARAPDPQGPVTDASDPEVPGEPRTRGWLEMILLDERGVATSPVRRLTSTGGHVTAFDLRGLGPAATPAAAPAGGNAPVLLVVARDDGEAIDGSGGTLLRVRVAHDAVEPPVAFTTDGLGRGAPIFVDGPATWLAWVGPGEQLRMLALDAIGTPAGAPSGEDGMDEARPVLALSSGHLLVETPADGVRQLRTFECR
jgi:hypothetical protein